MKIGIIGSGNIGSVLTRRFTALGHDVAVTNAHGPTSLSGLARETGARAVLLEEAVRGKDVVVVTIPLGRIEDLPPGLFAEAPRSLVVIDTCNYYPQQRDGRIDDIEAGSTESAWVERRLGHPVVKAFNTMISQHLLDNGMPAGTPGRLALSVAGDDPDAKAIVMRLVDEIGFDAVDAGSIADSWRQQPGSPGYTKDYDSDGMRRALSEARNERAPEWRATSHSPGTYALPA